MLRRLLLAMILAAVAVTWTLVPAKPAAAAAAENVLAFGEAPFAGSTGGLTLTSPLVGMAAGSTGRGYWLAARDGGVFAFGDAVFHGSTGNIRLNQPIVGLAGTSSGNGYWMVAADGGVFSFGDAVFHGSTGHMRLSRPVVAMAAVPGGNGYWMAAADGGVFSFGQAPFHGSAVGLGLARPVVAMAPTPDGGGYWLVAGDGSVYAFGNAPHLGNAPGRAGVSGIAGSPSGKGYWLLDQEGGVFAFGDAAFMGSGVGLLPRGTVAVGLAAAPSGSGYWVLAAAAPLVAGASGSPVRDLQSRLDALGYWVPVDGRFGLATTQALYALQKAAGIPRTGQFDAATARALDARVLPMPRSAGGYVAEVDKGRQLLMIVSNGRIVRVFNTSTGNGKPYRSGSGMAVAHTPEGSFTVYKQINGLRISALGELYRPKYFTGGYAIHGSPSIPPYPASHGCVRVSNAAIGHLWEILPLGTQVLVYS